MVYSPPNEKWLDSSQNSNTGYNEWLFTGKLGITDNSSRSGPNDTSLVMVLPYVSRAMCIAINRLLKHDGYDSVTPIEDDTSVLTDLAPMNKFNGEANDYELTARIDGEGTAYPSAPSDLAYWRRKHSGCTQGSDNRYLFFQTLIRR